MRKKMKIDAKIRKYSHSKDLKPFFEDISLNIVENGFYLLSGESGIGKSTLMKILLELNKGVFEGSISYTYDSKKTNGSELRKSGKIGYQSDEFNFLPWQTVEKNIYLPKKINTNLQAIDKSSVNSELEKLGLDSSILKMYPHELSFGMKARLGLIRACIYKPNILFLDELYSGIDDKNCDAINEYLSDKKKNSTIIAISHQIHKANIISDKHYELTKTEDRIELIQHK